MESLSSKIINYNRKKLLEYGWTPWNVGLEKNASDQEIYRAIIDFQKQFGDLDVDGMLGPMTHRRIETNQEFINSSKYPSSVGFLLVQGSPVPVNFRTVIAGKGSSTSLIEEGGHGYRNHPPTSVVWHWDAALNGSACHRILKKRKISSHGVIDNDGTFIQFLDLADHTGWHAGHRAVNKNSIGIDVSNAVYTKYNSWYQKHVGIKRPIIEATVHGQEYTLLGYYDAQIETARQLSLFIHETFGIPLSSPKTDTLIANPEDYKGHIAHYHIKKTKWDVAGFPFGKVLYEEDSIC